MLNEDINYKSIDSYLVKSYDEFKKYERFIFFKEILETVISNNFNGSLLDIGCAKGEFIYFLKDIFKNMKFEGMEYSQELLDIAQSFSALNNVKMQQADVLTFDLKKKFDIVTMAGVLSIFDEIELPLEQMCKHINSGGYGFIFGGFNKNDIDVLVRYKNHYVKSTAWENGWNMFSLKTMKESLLKYSDEIEFHQFKFKGNISKDPNPVKTSTIKTIDGDTILSTGANVLRDFYIIKFKMK